MTHIRFNSLHTRLLLLGALSVAIALVTACVGFIWTDLRALHQAKRRELQAQAEIVGFNSAAAILIGDQQAGEQILAPLSEQSTIAVAALYSEDGSLLAEYTAPNAQAAPRTAPRFVGHTTGDKGALEYVAQIVERGQRVGQLYLRADMRDFWRQTKEQLFASLIFVVASLAAALPFAWFLARAISRPILELADTAEFVTQHGDFTVRVENKAADEIGALYRAFNNMLQHVDASDQALKASQDELEDRVERRTAELQLQIRERERVQHDLVIAKDAAEAASRAKSEFLANMSHEIRTPMNGVLGLTELVLDTEMSPEQRESVEMVKSSAEALMTVINDILDFSKIEAGKMELDLVEFALSELLEDSLKSVALRAHRKGLELACDIHAGVPSTVVGDPGRLRQVLLNLLGNSLKFTEHGEISIRAELVRSTATETIVRFAVEDSGIGIAEDKQKLIFEAFSQADGSTTRKYGGTGLGLTISNQLVALMGGQLQVQSTVGKGSTFYFEACFGVASAETRPSIAVAPENLIGLAVLIVDDNATNRRILEGIIRSWGALPTAVNSGHDALAELHRAAADGSPYVLLLVDAMMPEMDGFMLVEQVRHTADFDRPIIMMLTSADGLGDAQRCRQLGLSAYLIKPVKSGELRQTVLTVLMPAATPEAVHHRSLPATVATKTTTDATANPTSVRILLAEDNLVNQRVAVHLLNKHGYTVTVAGNGREVLSALARQTFDLVLMDVQMPEMDGFEATRAIRTEELVNGKHLPIIAMTAHAMKGDRERCLAAGMDDYVTKPIQIAELLRAVQGAVSLAPNMVTPVTLAQPTTGCPFNRALALQRIGGDQVFLDEMVGLFLNDVTSRMNEVRAAVDTTDGPRLQRAVHTLKGAAGYLVAESVCAAAVQLEEIGASGNLSFARAALEVLEQEMDRLLVSLAELYPNHKCDHRYSVGI